jgi:hypothetical protein
LSGKKPPFRLARRKIDDFWSAFPFAERQARRSRPVTTHDLAKVAALTLPVW